MLLAVILLLNPYGIKVISTSPNNAGGAVTRLNDSGFEYRLGKVSFLLPETSKPPLVATPPPVQWASRFLLRVYKAAVA